MAAPLIIQHEACAACGQPFAGIQRQITCSLACKRVRDHEARRTKYAEDPSFRAKVHADVARWRKANPEKHRAVRRRAAGMIDPPGESRAGERRNHEFGFQSAPR